MLGRRPAGPAGQSDRIARLDRVVDPHEVFRVVGVHGLDAVVVADQDQIAVAAVVFRHPDDARKRGPDRIVRHRLDVDAGVHAASPIPERRDELARIRVAELVLVLAERQDQLARRRERIVVFQRNAHVGAFEVAESHFGTVFVRKHREQDRRGVGMLFAELVYVADRLRLIGTAFGRMAFDTRGRFLRNFPLFTLAAREHRFDG